MWSLRGTFEVTLVGLISISSDAFESQHDFLHTNISSLQLYFDVKAYFKQLSRKRGFVIF